MSRADELAEAVLRTVTRPLLFDPATIQDHATYDKPDQLATGVDDVFVNGVQVLKDGVHTGAKPGRVVRGPGWTGWPGGGACR
jgi:N-acyl-D-amino-acid deacylase